MTPPPIRLVLCPASPLEWPAVAERFPLARLVEVSGVDAETIKRWAFRGSIRFRRVGTGKVRAYHLDDALHLAVIAEMSRLGLAITGPGAMLSAAVAEWIEFQFRTDRDVRRLSPIALVPVDDGRDFEMDRNLSHAVEVGSCVIVGTRRIVEGVLQRFLAS